MGYGHFEFSQDFVFMRLRVNLQNGHNTHMTFNPKNKDTLFSRTFKIEENKVLLFFGLEVIWMGNGQFEFSQDFVFS